MGDHESAVQGAKEHGVLSLCFKNLTSVPPLVPSLHSLWRLDLGSNSLTTLPPLGSLRCLEELFLNDNPLAELPGSVLEGCFALQFLDVRRTLLRTLPPTLSLLPALLDVGLAGAPLEHELLEAGRVGGTSGLLALLRLRQERDGLLYQLRKVLALEVWKEAGDTEAGRAQLGALVAQCSEEFPENADLKAVCNNAVRLFVTDLPSATPAAARVRFEALRNDNERKALGAEIELAMRAIYYDAADPRLIARLRAEIVAALPSLQDTRFLLQHARALLPPTAGLIVPEQLPALVGALRSKLNAERDAACAQLLKALERHYADREPKDVEALARACAALLPRSEDIRSLAADAAELFPAEFASASVKKVVKAFRAAQEDKGMGTGGGGGGGGGSVAGKSRR
jgi:hypothetical protein